MNRLVALASLVCAVAALATVAGGCAHRARMCNAPSECGPNAGCVAGRCLPDGGTPAIQNARRWLVDPVDVAFLRRGDAVNGGEVPAIATLGRANDEGALLLLRFKVPIAKDAKILEAYLILERTQAVDSDPLPITLHAARIVDPWDGRSISWARQPRIDETRSPSTTADPNGRAMIRLDVRELVEHWRLHERVDQGIAVVADNTTPTGMAFALTVAEEATTTTDTPQGPSTSTFGGAGTSGATVRESQSGVERNGPRLELYVK